MSSSRQHRKAHITKLGFQVREDQLEIGVGPANSSLRLSSAISRCSRLGRSVDERGVGVLVAAAGGSLGGRSTRVLAAVELGIWQPKAQEPVEASSEEPTFHEYASAWLARREAEGLRPKTLVDLRWSLVNRLLPFFHGHRLSDITPREVKRYTDAKLAECVAIEEARRVASAKAGTPSP
jgi:Phage integrase, N-terminal SAM-like domain